MTTQPTSTFSTVTRVALAAIFVLSGCVASPPAALSPSPTQLSTPPPDPTSSPTPTPVPAGQPSASVAPSPAAEPSPATWSQPEAVGSGAGYCQAVTAVIDGAGGKHIAVACDGKIRYSVRVGTEWQTTEFATAAKRQELDPRLAVQGDVLYLAYTRIAVEEGGCGDPGLRDVGMYVRTRKLPAGGWSAPKLVGEVEDHVHALRVENGTIHATVENARDGRVYYETSRGAAYHRYLIPRATGVSSLRIGDDGKARVAYEADGAIWYGVFTGSGFASEKIDGSTNGYSPVLVLSAGDQPYLLWRRGPHEEGGCVGPGPEAIDGTYYGTLVGGEWKTEHLTPEPGAASLTIDIETSRIHVLANSPVGLVYLSRLGSGSWRRQLLENVRSGEAVIRLDPTNGALLVAYTEWDGTHNRVYAIHFE